jgi:hypothetical protein
MVLVALPPPQEAAKNPRGDKDKLEDGIYIWVADGPGRRVKRNDGAEVVLVRRLSGAFGKATLRSLANDNSRFRLELKNAGPLAGIEGGAPLAVVIAGVCQAAFGQSDLHPDGTLDLAIDFRGEKEAEKIAARLKVKPFLRKHPGHRYTVRWTAEKESYQVGEAVTLKMEIRNVGEAPFTFRVGGQQRGPRDNQFRFLAYRSSGHGRAVHDVGDPVNFGGISSNRTLKPGETFTAKVALDRWFSFLEPDNYRVTGLYELEMYDSNDQGSFARAIWNDLASGDCLVAVRAKSE